LFHKEQRKARKPQRAQKRKSPRPRNINI
jgi:hypothetical protein